MTTRRSISVRGALYDLIDAASKRTGMPKSALVEMVVNEALGEIEHDLRFAALPMTDIYMRRLR